MKYRSILKIGMVTIGLALCTACGEKHKKDQVDQNKMDQRHDDKRPCKDGEEPPQRPSTKEMFAEMDSDKDGRLSESEVKGPLQHDFSKIDTNNDGYIEEEELTNVPKPKGHPPHGKPPRGDNKTGE